MKKSALELIIKEEISKIIAEQGAQSNALMRELEAIAAMVAQLKVRLEKVMEFASMDPNDFEVEKTLSPHLFGDKGNYGHDTAGTFD